MKLGTQLDAFAAMSELSAVAVSDSASPGSHQPLTHRLLQWIANELGSETSFAPSILAAPSAGSGAGATGGSRDSLARPQLARGVSSSGEGDSARRTLDRLLRLAAPNILSAEYTSTICTFV